LLREKFKNVNVLYNESLSPSENKTYYNSVMHTLKKNPEFLKSFDAGVVRIAHENRGEDHKNSAAIVQPLVKKGTNDYVGNDIVFNTYYEPTQKQKAAILSHELQHVKQNNNMGDGALIDNTLGQQEKLDWNSRPLEIDAEKARVKHYNNHKPVSETEVNNSFRQTYNNLQSDKQSKNKLNIPFITKKDKTKDIYLDVEDEEFREEQQQKANLEAHGYGEVKSYSGEKVGNAMIVADIIIPSQRMLTLAGLGVKKHVDKVKFIKTDEHDNRYKIPKIEIHKKKNTDRWVPEHQYDEDYEKY
jgi:hypothetical protein